MEQSQPDPRSDERRQLFEREVRRVLKASFEPSRFLASDVLLDSKIVRERGGSGTASESRRAQALGAFFDMLVDGLAREDDRVLARTLLRTSGRYSTLRDRQEQAGILTSQSWERIRKAPTKRVVTHLAVGLLASEQGQAPSALHAQIHWGDAPVGSEFLGREQELLDVEALVAAESNPAQLLAIVGLGGAGKTALAVAAARRLSAHYDATVWQSMQSMPSVAALLDAVSLALSRPAEEVASVEAAVSAFAALLRAQPILLVLDNFESVLRDDKTEGDFRPGFEEYEGLIRSIATTAHESTVILTSREQPSILDVFAGSRSRASTYRIPPLGLEETTALLTMREVVASPSEVRALWERYDGNPYALQLVATYARDLLDGDIGAFLRQDVVLFGDIRRLIEEHVRRLSEDEKRLLHWLSLSPEPVALSTLVQRMDGQLRKPAILDALEILVRRSLLTASSTGFEPHAMLREYFNSRLIETVASELAQLNEAPMKERALVLLDALPLVDGQAREHARTFQENVILRPVANELRAAYRPAALERLLTLATDALREPRSGSAGYFGASNILRLFVQLGLSLAGRDFSRLRFVGGNFEALELHRTDFTECAFSHSTFSDTFGSVTAVSFGPDAKLIASGTFEGRLRLWRIPNGENLLNVQAHTDWISGIQFSKTSEMLFLSSSDGWLSAWRTSGEELARWQAHEGPVRGIALAPFGDVLISVGEDGYVRAWNSATTEEVWSEAVSTQRLKAVAFSNDGASLAATGDDGLVRVMNATTGVVTHTLAGHEGWARDVAFIDDGADHLVSVGDDGTVRHWDVDVGVARIIGRHVGRVWCVAVPPEGGAVATGGNDSILRLWDLHDGGDSRGFLGHTSWIRDIEFSDDGETLLSGGEDQQVRVWDVPSGRPLETIFGVAHRAFCVAFSPDGKTLFAGLGNHRVGVWDVDDGSVTGIWSGHTDQVFKVACAPNGTLLASGSDDGEVRIWDVASGKTRFRSRHHMGWIGAVAFSPDGAFLASGADDRKIALVETTSGRVVRELTGHAGRVSGLAFLSAPLALVSCSEDGSLRYWNIDDGTQHQVAKPEFGPMFALAVSPDGTWCVAGGSDGVLRIWSLPTGELLGVLKGHSRMVWTLEVTPDGSYIVSGGDDGTVRLWDAREVRPAAILGDHSRQVWSVAVSPDGERVASCSEDGTVKLWQRGRREPIRHFRTPRRYEGMLISGVTGLSEGQLRTLHDLGAVE